MINVTFERIHRDGQVIADNPLYRHIHHPELLLRYDSNFMEFKRMPSLQEFLETARQLRAFHRERGQKHLKFYLPANEKPSPELMEQWRNDDYDIGILELYAIDPAQFPSVEPHPDIEIQAVTDDNLDIYVQLQDKRNVQYGEEYAGQIRDWLQRRHGHPGRLEVLAFYRGVPAGSVDVIVSAETAEIDNLSVEEAYQRKGIGSRLQRFVMDRFPDKTVILVADREDTPREMYRKQNYRCFGFQYHIFKVYGD